MASLGLTTDELKALDATRLRLQQLTNSIASLRNDIYTSNPLPSPESLQASASILQSNLSYLLEILNEHNATFQRVAIHPSTNFPGRTQEQVLVQLLRKKLEPDTASRLENGREAALTAGISTQPGVSFVSQNALRARKEQIKQERRDERRRRDQAKYQSMNVDDDDDEEEEDDEDDEDDEDYQEEEVNEPIGAGDVWSSARLWCQQRLGDFVRKDLGRQYTAEERARGVAAVRTGLRRTIDDDDSEDDDGEEADSDDDDETAGDVIMGEGGAMGASASGQAGSRGGGTAAVANATRPNNDIEKMIWFMTTGSLELPAYIEISSQKREQESQNRR